MSSNNDTHINGQDNGIELVEAAVSTLTVAKLKSQVKHLTKKIRKLEAVINKFFVCDDDKLIVKQIECENLLVTNDMFAYGGLSMISCGQSYQESHYYLMSKLFGEPVNSEIFRSFNKTKQLTNEFMHKLQKRNDNLALKAHKKRYKDVMKYLVLTTQQIV